MKIRTIARYIAFVVSGFVATTVLMFIYGCLLALFWERIFQVPWPTLGPNAAEAIFRGRLLDALFGFVAGLVMAVAVVRAQRLLDVRAAPVLAGALLYAATSVPVDNVVRDIMESPMPALLIGFCAASWWLRMRVESTSTGD